MNNLENLKHVVCAKVAFGCFWVMLRFFQGEHLNPWDDRQVGTTRGSGDMLKMVGDIVKSPAHLPEGDLNPNQ